MTASVRLKLWALVGFTATANFMLYLDLAAIERRMEERQAYGLDPLAAISVLPSLGAIPRGSSTGPEAVSRAQRHEDQWFQLIPLSSQSVASLDNRCIPDGKARAAVSGQAGSDTPVDSFGAPEGCWSLASVPALVSEIESPAYLGALQLYCFAATLIALALAIGACGQLSAHTRLVQAIGHRRQPVPALELRCPVSELEVDIVLLNRLLVETQRLADEMRRAAEDDAHDLKSPLGLVRVTHRRIRRVLLPATNTKALAALDVADQAIDRMVESIESAQALAEERAALPGSPRWPVNVARVVDQCRRSLESTIWQKDLRVIIDQREDIVLSTAADLLETLLVDVLTNAVEASPDGGEIVVEARIEDGEAMIAVADGGAAISSTWAGALFSREPLVGSSAVERLGAAKRRYFKAKRSADLLGGTLIVGNQPGGGVLAVVYLPT